MRLFDKEAYMPSRVGTPHAICYLSGIESDCLQARVAR